MGFKLNWKILSETLTQSSGIQYTYFQYYCLYNIGLTSSDHLDINARVSEGYNSQLIQPIELDDGSTAYVHHSNIDEPPAPASSDTHAPESAPVVKKHGK